MKNIFTAFLLIISGTIGVNAGIMCEKSYSVLPDPDSTQRIATINANDTVVFDLSQATNTAGSVEFPVYFLSDDTIYALDYAFKFDMAKFAYDSTINLMTSNLTILAHVAGDSVLRLTSYSLQAIANNTPVVSVRFTKLAGQPICNQDIDSIYSYLQHAFLNGDPCSLKIIECVSTGILQEENNENGIRVYPNPASEYINISTQYKSELSILSPDGRRINNSVMLSPGAETKVNLKNLSSGIYLLQFKSYNGMVTKKIFVDHN